MDDPVRGTVDLAFLGRNVAAPRRSFADIKPGDALHGLTDGSWSLIDALLAIAEHTGPADLTCATWTAASADLSTVERALERSAFRSVRFLVDRSFQTRQPAYCDKMRALFGEPAIRVWSSHAKFALLTGGVFDVLYLTSANLNANRRLENFSLFAGGDLPGHYMALVADMWAAQGDGEGLGTPKVARRQQKQVQRRQPVAGSVTERLVALAGR